VNSTRNIIHKLSTHDIYTGYLDIDRKVGAKDTTSLALKFLPFRISFFTLANVALYQITC
jgi:hypothetical protein